MSSVIRCPNCGHEIDSGSRFCEHCAARLCPGCHGVVPPRSKFCPHCGFAVGPALPGQEESRPAPAPPPHFQPPTAGYGGITGPKSQQVPPSYRSAPPHGEPPPAMGIPIPRAVSPQEMAPEQPEVGAEMPRFAPARGGGVRQFPRQPLMPEGPILARRFPAGTVVTVVVIALVGLLVFLGFNLGWFQGESWQKPLNAVQQFFGSIRLPSWLSFFSGDTVPPVISEVAVTDITESGGTVVWVTDEPANSQVMICDPEGRCTWTDLDETLVTEHSVVLSGLETGLTYHLTIASTDAKGNQTLHETDFTTKAKETGVALAISGVNVTNVTDTGATIVWSTNRPARGQVEYGTTGAYGNTTPLSAETTDHKITLSGLSPNTTYHYRVRVQGNTGEAVTSDDRTFKTGSATAGLETGTTVGKLALDFTLPDLEGKQVKLSQYRGKVVMVKFWVDSQSCRNELPVIQSFYEKWADKGFVVLAVNWMQTPEQVKAFMQQKGLTFTVLLDQKGEVNDKYGVKPSIYAVTVLVDRDGVIRDRREAAFKSELQIETLVKPLLQAE